MPMINLGREQNGYYWDLAGTVWYKYGLPSDCDKVDMYRRGGIFTFVADSDPLIDQAIAGCNLSDLCPNSRS